MQPMQFDESYYPLPPAAQEADPAADMRDLLFRLGKAESSLQECEMQRSADVQEVLLELIDISDHVMDAIEEAGVPSNAKETSLINGLIGFGKALRELLDRHQVEAIVTIGMPLDASVAEAVGYEQYAQVPPTTVLRERRIGYRWPGGTLRQAQVIVAGAAPPSASSSEATHIGPAPVG